MSLVADCINLAERRVGFMLATGVDVTGFSGVTTGFGLLLVMTDCKVPVVLGVMFSDSRVQLDAAFVREFVSKVDWSRD